jgi:hypothetical protein
LAAKDADSRSANKEITRLLKRLEFLLVYPVHSSPAVVRVLSRLNPIPFPGAGLFHLGFTTKLLYAF